MVVETEVISTYHIDSEAEVKEFIEDVKQKAAEEGYLLKTYSIDHKEKKQKGEVIDDAYQVKTRKVYYDFWEV